MDLGLSIGAGEVRKRGDTAACGEAGVRRKGGHRQWSEEEGHPSLQLELKLSWPNGLGINHQPGSSGPPAAAATTSASTEGARVAANGPPKAAAAIADRENCDTGPSSSTSRSTAAGRVGWRCTDEDGGGGAGRKKLRLNKEQSCYLEESFKEHTTLNPKQKLAIAKKLNLRPRQVEVWFQNRRARTKLKQTEVEYEYMKRCCESLTEENRRLHREIQELRSLKAAPPPPPPPQQQLLRLHVPAATLRMCPSCERAAARGAGGRRTGGFHIPLKPRDGHPKIAFPVS